MICNTNTVRCHRLEIHFEARLITCHVFLLLQVKEQRKSDSSENQEENSVIENDAEANKSPASSKTQNELTAVGHDESCNHFKEENLVEMNKKKEEEQKVCGVSFFTFLFVLVWFFGLFFP